MQAWTVGAPVDEVRTLLRRWHEDGDETAREALDDLEQVASLGLVKAVDRFDVTRDVRFATFAVPTIAGELKRHFRDRSWMMRVPREVQELSSRLSRARERLVHDLSRSHTAAE